MKIIETLNSTYEVDEEEKLVRRVVGKSQPCNFIGADGEWRPFHSLHYVNGCVMFTNADSQTAFITSTVLYER